jgi:hypothetical protein
MSLDGLLALLAALAFLAFVREPLCTTPGAAKSAESYGHEKRPISGTIHASSWESVGTLEHAFVLRSDGQIELELDLPKQDGRSRAEKRTTTRRKTPD